MAVEEDLLIGLRIHRGSVSAAVRGPSETQEQGQYAEEEGQAGQ
jgi:hypothetical protein